MSTFPCPCLCLEACAAACTNNQQLCVHTFHSFDTHLRIAGVLLSFLRNLCLSGFLFLSCHPSCFCHIPFPEDGMRRYSKVADCCSCGGVAITLFVIVSLFSTRLDRQDRAYPRIREREVPVVEVFARCVRLWLPDTHALWARFRHRLSHCSRGFRESCHRCVHRSTRRLLTNFNHMCSELIELTSQHLNFLSRCHRHLLYQYQEYREYQE